MNTTKFQKISVTELETINGGLGPIIIGGVVVGWKLIGGVTALVGGGFLGQLLIGEFVFLLIINMLF